MIECDHCHEIGDDVEHATIVLVDGTIISATLHEACVDDFVDAHNDGLFCDPEKRLSSLESLLQGSKRHQH